MWFLRGRPTDIYIRGYVESVDSGYQKTSIRFNINADPNTLHEGKVWVAISFPWSPHKENGSLKLLEQNMLEHVEPNEEIVKPTIDDIQIWDRLRALKSEDNIELVHVQELINWHLDDVGVMTFWAEPGKTFQLDYSHKIASDSRLFFPTRLPTLIANKTPNVDCKLWVKNAVLVDIEKQLERASTTKKDIALFTFKDWNWDLDTRFSTDNWESSDDEFESSEETN